MSVEKALRELTATVDSTTMLLQQQTNERNALIVRAHEDGATFRQIAEWAGMSHQRVAQIVNP